MSDGISGVFEDTRSVYYQGGAPSPESSRLSSVWGEGLSVGQELRQTKIMMGQGEV